MKDNVHALQKKKIPKTHKEDVPFSPRLPLNTSRCLVIHPTQNSLSLVDALQQTTVCLLSVQEAEAACFSRNAPTPPPEMRCHSLARWEC